MIKNWILQHFFKQQIRDLKIQAFRDANKDILETMKDDLDVRAATLAQEKLSTLMSPINWQHVVTLNERQGVIYIGKVRADHAQLQALRAEAEQFAASGLWQLLYETPNALAQNTMFRTGEDTDAFKKGRSMIFFLDSQKKIVDLLRGYQHVPK